MMRKLYVVFLFFCVVSIAQTRETYVLEIKPNYDLGVISTIRNQDSTLTVTSLRSDLSALLNARPLYEIKRAFPTAVTPRLQRVYVLQVGAQTAMGDVQNWEGTANFFVEEATDVLADDTTAVPPQPLPDDYPDAFLGQNNFELELIKAPLAWSITPGGDPSVLVGISDSKFLPTHYDLDGQILYNIPVGVTSEPHGTGVTGMIAAKTNNGSGIASLAYNVKLVTASTNISHMQLIDGLLELSQQPGMRVINCSWVVCDYHSAKTYLDDVMMEVTSNNILVVGAAGNGTSGANCISSGGVLGYCYPASYDQAVSVTSVGSRYPIGYYHNLQPMNDFWHYSWRDCHYGRPDLAQGYHTHNDKVDVSAPGILVLSITDRFNDYPAGYRLATGTSEAAPIVSALAALLFSVNPALTPAQVKQIIEDTADDIYYIPYNQDFIGKLGTGRINAYRAVLTAKCMLEPNPTIDLAMQDSAADVFAEPDTLTSEPWNSKDIWVRNQPDGKIIKEHQTPTFDPTSTSYVYVRVTNNSCIATSGNDTLRTYWTKASTSISWPSHWDGSLFMYDAVANQDVLMGDLIAAVPIPALQPGQEVILEIPWTNMPDPNHYVNINPEAWHFCLLARIESLDDPMTTAETENIVTNVLNNNNIAWKNVSIVHVAPDVPKPIGAVVTVGNHAPRPRAINLEFKKDGAERGKPIYEEAEVSVEMDSILYRAWQRGGSLERHTKQGHDANKRIITGDHAVLQNIMLDSSEVGTLAVKFNFLTKQLTNKERYVYQVVQRDENTTELIGGETYEIIKTRTEPFFAFAGNDQTIHRSETVTLSASEIAEAATYKWYDIDDNLIYTGRDFSLSPEFTSKYKLEVVSNIDGFKDYDETQVFVRPYRLSSITPNPATSQIYIDYVANGASSAYIMVVNIATGSMDNYIIDVDQTSKSINLSGYNTGTYAAVLICDGEIQDSKNFVKQ